MLSLFTQPQALPNLYDIFLLLLSWITEINELFHDILIYLDAPV